MLDDNAESSEEQGQEDPHPSEEEPPPQKKRKLGDILQKDKGAQPTEDRATRVSKEIDRHLQAPQQDSTEDPLEWCKANVISCPALSRLSKTYLCISATSSASEHLFSTAGNVVTKKRSLIRYVHASSCMTRTRWCPVSSAGSVQKFGGNNKNKNKNKNMKKNIKSEMG